MAFFSDSGRRTASVRALTEIRLVVLRRRFLEELNRDDPAAGFRILMNVGRIMAERFAELSAAPDS